MLTSINFKNFKSYQQATLPLAAVTFLIGANASGKSNALEAIRLLHWLAKGTRLDDIEREIGGKTAFRGYVEDLFHAVGAPLELGASFSTADEAQCDFEIAIQFRDKKLSICNDVLKPESDMPFYDMKPDGNGNLQLTINNQFTNGPNEWNQAVNGQYAMFYRLENILPNSGPNWAKALRLHLRNIFMLNAHPAAMRGYANLRDEELEEDGSNLSAVLHRICQQSDGAKQQLLSFIRSLPEQDITDIRFIETERRDVMVRLQENFGGRQRLIDAPLLSDGTLRVLAIAAALLTAPEGALVIIEEIDNGVHPSRAELLLQQMSAIAGQRHLRLLLTSHNPALLDALPDQALADVLCCYRDPQDGNSRLVRLGDMEHYPELIAQGQRV